MVIQEGMGLEDFSMSLDGELGKSFFKKLKKLSPGRVISKLHRKINPVHKLFAGKKKKSSAPAPEPTYYPEETTMPGGEGPGGYYSPGPSEAVPMTDPSRRSSSAAYYQEEPPSEEGGEEEGGGDEDGQAPAADTGKKPPVAKPASPLTVAPTATTGLPSWAIWAGGLAIVGGVVFLYLKKKGKI